MYANEQLWLCFYVLIPYSLLFSSEIILKQLIAEGEVNINLLLSEREGRTGEYWPEVVTVRTEHREVRTKTTEGQYSPVQLEQARLVSSLLYGTRAAHDIHFSFKRTSGQLNSKDFRRVMTRATQKEQATTTLKKLHLLNIFRTFHQRNLRF